MIVSQRSDYTFKYNQKLGRHGWLRLTPAYSVKLVSEIISHLPQNTFILDPFSGTATTGLVATEQGLSAHCCDINPFLVWFGNAKLRNYSKNEIEELKNRIKYSIEDCKKLINQENWLPNIYNINRWWSQETLQVLSALRQGLVKQFGEPKYNRYSLVWIAFCRLVIETSSAAFHHVSMSFKETAATYQLDQILRLYQSIFNPILESASQKNSGKSIVYLADSREPILIDNIKYSHVITSPPYPNRISYIRELRPYMYWTKFLNIAQEAGELDWQAIGGTWGIATSRLQHWQPSQIALPTPLEFIVSQILNTKEKNALLMANYVWKYFHDMHLHFDNLRNSLKKDAVITYIVGNSSFYGIQVPTHKLLAESLRELGYDNIETKIVRKRNSKKELYEYCVSATYPSANPNTLA